MIVSNTLRSINVTVRFKVVDVQEKLTIPQINLINFQHYLESIYYCACGEREDDVMP